MGGLNFLFQLIVLLINSRSLDQASYYLLAKNFLLMNSNLKRQLEHHFVGLLSKFWV